MKPIKKFNTSNQSKANYIKEADLYIDLLENNIKQSHKDLKSILKYIHYAAHNGMINSLSRIRLNQSIRDILSILDIDTLEKK